MDSGFKRILEKLELLRSTHIKMQLPDRRSLIKQYYERFITEFEDEANISISEDRDSIGITITTKSILSCDQGGYSFNCLIGLANFTNIETLNGTIVIDLWFRLWEWIEKAQ